MHSFRKKWIAVSLLSGCAMAGTGPAGAAEMNSAMPAQGAPGGHDQIREPLAIFLDSDDALLSNAAVPDAASAETSPHDFDIAASTLSVNSRSAMAAQTASAEEWVAVDSAVLDDMRGGFDLAPGLKVSFGIERVVNLNGILQTATRIEVPDAAKLIQAQQGVASPATQLSAVSQASGSTVTIPANNDTTGKTISLPISTNLGGGATALIQNGLGNMATTGILSPEAAATVIQNSANNQTIQSVTVINAATNSLDLLKGANLRSTLLDALTQSARIR